MKNIPPAGEYPYIDNKFIEHPYDDTNVGEVVWKALSKTMSCVECHFESRKTKQRFSKIEFVVEAFNLGLNEDFVLDKYEIDLTQYPTDSTGAQQFNVDQSRDSKLNSGNNKKWVKVKREPAMDTVEFNGYIFLR
jgi:hypothetical protein